MKTASVIDRYDLLVARAIDIVSGSSCYAPYHKFISGDEQDAKLWLDGDEAVLVVPDDTMEYDCSAIEREAFRFPAAWLEMSETEYEAWKAKEAARYEAEYAQKSAAESRARASAQGARERAAYEALKRKYGP